MNAPHGENAIKNAAALVSAGADPETVIRFVYTFGYTAGCLDAMRAGVVEPAVAATEKVPA